MQNGHAQTPFAVNEGIVTTVTYVTHYLSHTSSVRMGNGHARTPFAMIDGNGTTCTNHMKNISATTANANIVSCYTVSQVVPLCYQSLNGITMLQ